MGGNLKPSPTLPVSVKDALAEHVPLPLGLVAVLELRPDLEAFDEALAERVPPAQRAKITLAERARLYREWQAWRRTTEAAP